MDNVVRLTHNCVSATVSLLPVDVRGTHCRHNLRQDMNYELFEQLLK